VNWLNWRELAVNWMILIKTPVAAVSSIGLSTFRNSVHEF
jgi:hypothetical protein